LRDNTAAIVAHEDYPAAVGGLENDLSPRKPATSGHTINEVRL
jgi:hypothetical protein